MLTLDEIRDDALETLNNYGERFTVEVAKLYPDDPDDDQGEMTITAMSRDGKRVLFRDTCFVHPTYRTYGLHRRRQLDRQRSPLGSVGAHDLGRD